MTGRSSDLVSIRAAMRRAILDHGHIETWCKSPEHTRTIHRPNEIRVYGAQGRLIARFTPNDKRYDAALIFWMGLDTHTHQNAKYAKSTTRQPAKKHVQVNPLRYRASGKNPERSPGTQDAIRSYDSQF